ncbi:hypothetical protein FQZ97_1078400 [compost metagenome]
MPTCKLRFQALQASAHVFKLCSMKEPAQVQLQKSAQANSARALIRKSRSARRRFRRWNCSISRFPLFGARLQHLKMRSTLPNRVTANRMPRLPTLAAASMWRWRSACRNLTAIALISSAACVRFFLTRKTSALSATVSCSSQRCFSRLVRLTSTLRGRTK